MAEHGIRDDDIAIVGLACRFPAASSPRAFWDLLRNGGESIGELPPNRRDLALDFLLGTPEPGRSGWLRAGFLDHVDRFDAKFFGISPREAAHLDPQQRLVLELGWEGLEDFGVVPAALAGSRTGVFMGAMRDDFAVLVHRLGLHSVSQHTFAGLQRGMIANRLSHFLRFTGPSLTLDTGQSSSLTAVHMACESLQRGECTLALAGGVNVILVPQSTVEAARFGGLSPDGRCFVFDVRANGFVRGEGGGLVVLKPLAAALADGDRVHCIIRGSAVNNDGGGGLTVPNCAAQQEVLRLAYHRSGIDPGDVQYVELHGTGTKVGDPVEASALGAVLGAGRGADTVLRVGSAKTNVGHLEAAAGIAGLLKTVLALCHQEIPPSLNFRTAPPGIPLGELGLRVQTVLEPWDSAGGLRIAGVSAFGMGGTNCHVVLTDPPGPQPASRGGKQRAGSVPQGDVAWVVSGRSEQALRAQAEALLCHVEEHPEHTIADIAHSLATTRSAFEYRAVVIAGERAVFLEGLRALAVGCPHVCVVLCPARKTDATGLARTGEAAAVRGSGQPLPELARAYIRGEAVDWAEALAAAGGRRVELPTYAFQRQRHWPAETDGADVPVSDIHTASAGLRPVLESMPVPERQSALLDLVRTEVAAVLEYSGPSEVEEDRCFNDLGMNSLTAVELAQRLSEATSLPLHSGLVYDHPTPDAVARFLHETAFAHGTVIAPQVSSSVQEPQVPAEARGEPIAVVGMGCRFPGGIHSPESLWEAVAAGRDLLGSFPDNRDWDLDRLFDPDPDRRGTSYVRQGGFLHDAAEFDAEFFGISPREALAMDPQQRLLLEVAWEAAEHAAIDPASLRGSATGVFVGVIPQQYETRVLQSTEDLEGYIYTGNTTSVLAGRVAYTFGFVGPALAVDTACSSSLVATHLACRSLREGECSLALAGGVTVMSTPAMFVEFSRQRALAPDGRSKAFAAAADGTGWSEGAGLLLLERLSDARRNGHQVLAVVRGSALNEDGASNGLTAPNGPSQQRVLQGALDNAGLGAQEVDAVEAHGPGTTLGDPIEANALLAVYGRERPAGQPLWLGSVKSNIGHTQAAAGVAGLIKMVMAIRHGLLPRTLHVDQPTGHVDWSGGTVRLLTEARAWPELGRPRRAGVSSFGAGGTNAHVIVEQAPPDDAAAAAQPGLARAMAAVLPWPLSARSDQALSAQAGRLRQHLAAGLEPSPADIGYTLACGRSAFGCRAVLVAADLTEFQHGLAALERGGTAASLVRGTARQGTKPVFVFPGQGAQWPGMAAELLQCSPVFRDTAQHCADSFAAYLDWPVLDVLRGVEGSPSLDRVDVVQPALFTMMVSLTALWRSYGVEPSAVVGHSQGEIAAAHVAGALSLDDATRIVALRSRALLALAGCGAMAAVGVPVDDLRRRTGRWTGLLGIAAVNSPLSTTIGGDPRALEELLAELARDKVEFRRLPGVNNAGHSAQVESLRDHLLDVLSPVAPGPADVPFYSTVTGGLLDTGHLDAEYWYRNAREPVQFEQACRALLDSDHGLFIEVNPHPLLHMALEETIADSGRTAAAIGSLRRNEDAPRRFLTSVAEAWAHGAPVDWRAAFTGTGARLTTLPAYPFQRQRYWCEASSTASDAVGLGVDTAEHPLLGAAVPLPHNDGLVLTGRVSRRSQPWLADHAVWDKALLPATAFVDIAGAAGRRLGCDVLTELDLEAPLWLPDTGACHLQVVVEAPAQYDTRAFSVYAKPETASGHRSWTRHARGTLAPRPSLDDPADAVPGLWPPSGAEPVDLTSAYEHLNEVGYGYGATFRCLRRMWRHDSDLLAEVALNEETSARTTGFGLHPALLDAALHAVLLEPGSAPHTVRMPFSWNGVRLHATGASRLRVRIRPTGANSITLMAADSAGQPVVSVESMAFRPVTREHVHADAPVPRDALFQVEWAALPPGNAPAATSTWAMIGDDGVLGLAAAEMYPTVASLAAALETGAPTPDAVVAPIHARADLTLPGAVHDQVHRALALLQAWLADDRFNHIRLTVLTHGAVSVDAREDIADLPAAAVWGLVRSAQAEHPQRFTLLDLDDHPATRETLSTLLTTEEPQLIVRHGVLFTPRLTHALPAHSLGPPPHTSAWRVDVPRRGTLDGLAWVECEEHTRPLAEGQVRIGVRAAGLNFVDVIIAMDLFPGTAALGREFAGIVTEVGPKVSAFAPGDRVLGIVELATGALGPVVTTDHRMMARIPQGWSFDQAASMPIAYLTAYYGLVELARLQPGESVLVHAATGGVGMAAVQLAAHIGAEVFATAHPDKWEHLTALGIGPDHIASSRTLDFEKAFLQTTSGRGTDVVLNSLPREFVDASARLLPRGGRFMEMGKTDIREPADIAEQYAGVTYQVFDVLDAGPESIQRMLTAVLGLFTDGALQPLPVTTWDVRHAPEAFRHFKEAKHTGKIVLTIPQPPDPKGTVLITGGTGMLGGLLARQLVVRHGVRHLLLASRQGPQAPEAARLVRELTELGATTTVSACDISDRQAVADLLAAIPAEHPLTAVVHAAGTLDDGVLTALTPQRCDHVLKAKADGAWNLHMLTRHENLTAFILCSSVAGVLGQPAQANYAAANTFLDALAQHRAAHGLPAQSLAWGLWEQASAMSGHLSARDVSRMEQGGLLPLATEEGLALFDAAWRTGDAVLMAARVDTQATRSEAAAPLLHSLLRPDLKQAAPNGADSARSLQHRLSGLPAAERDRALLELVREQAAAALRLPAPQRVPAERPFREAGFDSLTSVELRNRLNRATGAQLPVSAIFDHPTPVALAAHVHDRLFPDDTATRPAVLAELARFESVLSVSPTDPQTASAVMTRLESVLARMRQTQGIGAVAADPGFDLTTATANEVFQLIDDELGLLPTHQDGEPTHTPEQRHDD
ncbi:SDR family NAD(P)-dependent oxidoreductase [Streptomyces sp. ET3-23]|uniref:type I polyketide synthase n=1 Tax=Streptomyces sp. ET3-23 TaxID=2885643 RepID=UPI001D1210F4|nr:type I polyketide synthase [Streptomyces sp. ET3-23]MCC2275220.1 SDR family NAD(P)-dependent oxidoreductase [Streptomyces sp. ET3-23]